MIRANHGDPNRQERVLSITLILLLAVTPVSNLGASDRPAVSGLGSLSISTDPAGAHVYVDGEFAGQSPLANKKLSIGDHRVRVVKSGYLENARILNVSSGQPTSIQIKLTRQPDAANKTDGDDVSSLVVKKKSGGLLKNKWLWVAVAGAGAGGAAAYVLTKNAAPLPGTIAVTPTGTGMAGVTSFTFNAQGARDPDGDTLGYDWNFGDGSTGTGASPTHTYNNPGMVTVTLVVNDGRGKSAQAPNTTVTIGQNVTATWTGGKENFFGCSINVSLRQFGGDLTGSMMFAGTCTGVISGVTGSVNPLTHPATVSWQTPSYTFTAGGKTYNGQIMSFSGTTNGDGTSMTGSLRLRQVPGTFDQSYSATYTR